MENQNLNLSSILKGNRSSKLDRNAKFLMYSCSRKENIVSGEIPQFYSNCLKRLNKKYKCTDESSSGKLKTCPEENLEVTQNIFKIDKNSRRPEKRFKIKKGLSRCRKELMEFSTSTKGLEEQYMQLSSELNEMKQKHDYVMANRNYSGGDFDTYSNSSTTGPEYALMPKSTQIFEHNKNLVKIVSNAPLKNINYQLPNDPEKTTSVMINHKSETVDQRVHQQVENKENMAPLSTSSSSEDIEHFVLSSTSDKHSEPQRKPDVSSLKNTITKLQNDSDRFCSIIEKQKNTLSDYRLRFVKAQHLVKEQQSEIEQLNSKNQQLEMESTHIIDELHKKVKTKLKDVDMLYDKMRGEQVKREHTIKENYALNERIQAVEAEAKQLKVKLEEMVRRKMAIISRLKVAERDLKIFKNYNNALKEEKRKLNEEMKNMSEQLDNMQNVSKRTLNRHREQNEKQRRHLQKRIFELEMKLNRSQTSTSSLIQERDSLISELQNQLNNLVHNFEVSQKHIRVLRRHICTICGNNSKSVIPNR